MKKMLALGCMAIAAILTAGAKNVSESTWSFGSAESRMTQGDASMFVKPIVVELVPKSKTRLKWRIEIKGDDYVSRLAYTPSGDVNIEGSQFNMQTYAVYLASVGELASTDGKSMTCDVLLAPLFNMQFTESNCIVEFTGYPADYANWQTATVEEFQNWILNENRVKRDSSKATVRGTVGVEEVSVKQGDRLSGLLR